jgi:glycosyltransferase involved in cell wall biosynthesis
MKHSKVSIIIPCYNVDDYIEECVDSAIAQTYSNIEIICIDNNSTDNTFEILKKLKAQGRIELYKELKKGAPAARNLGLKHAKGDWIQFLDADDLLLPDKIAHQIKLIDKNEFVGFIAGASKKMNLKGILNITLPFREKYLGLLKANLGNSCANMFNRLELLSIGGWEESMQSSQEYDLMFRLIKNGSEVIFDNQPLTIIRERESGQISQRNPGRKWKQYVGLLFEIADYIKINEVEYFIEKQVLINQTLFDSIRILAKYDLPKANEYFMKLSKGYEPDVSEVTTKNYLKLFRLFGFKKTEIIKRWLSK